MARYEHLPIFKRMMELTIFIENNVRNFSRYHKNTLGSELRTMCRMGTPPGLRCRPSFIRNAQANEAKSPRVELDATHPHLVPMRRMGTRELCAPYPVARMQRQRNPGNSAP